MTDDNKQSQDQGGSKNEEQKTRTLENFHPVHNYVLLRGVKAGVKLDLQGVESQTTGIKKMYLEKKGPGCEIAAEEGDEIEVYIGEDRKARGIPFQFDDVDNNKYAFLLLREQEILGFFKQ